MIAIITDLHWGVRSNSLFFLDRMDEFYYDFFIPYLKDNGIKTVWILGDVFENRKLLNIQVINRAQAFFRTLECEGILVYCLNGNHDYFYKNTNLIGSLAPILKPFSNVRLIDKWEVYPFNGVPVAFINWISPELKEEAMKWLSTVDATILCGHFEISSFEIIKNVVCHGGLDLSVFDRFDCVFSGHFHIRSSKKNVHYVGNPYQTNWGEAGYEKGFYLFEPELKQKTFVKNPVDLFATFQYTDSLDILSFDPTQFSNKIVRVFAERTSSKNRKKLEMLIEIIGAVSYNVELIEDREVLVDNSATDELIYSDTSQIIKQFLTDCQIDHLDKNKIEHLIFEIYQEAIEKSLTQC